MAISFGLSAQVIVVMKNILFIMCEHRMIIIMLKTWSHALASRIWSEILWFVEKPIRKILHLIPGTSQFFIPFISELYNTKNCVKTPATPSNLQNLLRTVPQLCMILIISACLDMRTLINMQNIQFVTLMFTNMNQWRDEDVPCLDGDDVQWFHFKFDALLSVDWFKNELDLVLIF